MHVFLLASSLASLLKLRAVSHSRGVKLELLSVDRITCRVDLACLFTLVLGLPSPTPSSFLPKPCAQAAS